MTIRRLSQSVRICANTEEGAVLPLVGLCIFVLLGSVGIAVDTGRAQLVQSKLSSSLDAAGLAGGSTVSTVNLNAEVEKYLAANFQDYLGATLIDTDIEVNADNTIITLSATASLPTTFMQLFGRDTVEVTARSEITRESRGLELVMVLDNTGSMAGTPLESLKTAATDMVNILFGNNEALEDLWVGVVPFSQTVNIGNTRTSWMDSTSYNWGPTSWGGCVDARLNGYDTTDDPPSVRLFTRYYWPDDDDNNDWRRSDGTYRSVSSTRGPNKYCPQTVLPMISSKSAVLSSIDSMEAVGNTHIGLGAVWGWRMLSPRWRGLWGGSMNASSLPLDYNTPLMNKAAIIMTDGENTMSNSVRSAYWYLSDGRLGTTNGSTAVTRLNTRLTTVCNRMKNNNIIVYTIAFNSPGTSVENLLRNCATQPDFYFDSPNSADLQQAFRTIGDSLANLRVSR